MPNFDGQVTIKVRFRNKLQYQKFRKYILKTDWDYGEGQYPSYEQLKLEFHNVEDLNLVTKHIVQLLQIGFEVYSCRYELAEHVLETEHPTEEDPEVFDVKDFNVSDMIKDIWNAIK